LVASGTAVARPSAKNEAPSEPVKERALRVATLRTRLLAGVPDARAERSEEQQARWVLAYLLDWHRREDKVGWWEYFNLCGLPVEELYDEQDAIAGLELVERVNVSVSKTGRPTGPVTDRYRYPEQEMEIGRKDDLKLQDGTKFGEVVAVDRIARTIDVKKGKAQADLHPAAAFAHKYINVDVLEDALFQLGLHVAEHGIDGAVRGSDTLTPATGNTQHRAALDLLLRRPPRLASASFAARDDESATDFATRVVGALDESVLAIQGPPGSGKTYTGARMICSLVAAGKRVGITGPSHKVVRNLLDAVAEAARATGTPMRLMHKVTDADDSAATDEIAVTTSNPDALAALQNREIDVLGGTAWLWARSEFARSVQVLFVDEAGQMSLANALAVSGAADSMVLLGDPQQLDQPTKGSHPDGVGVSALEHILGDQQTIPDDRGIFLPTTWRLCPRICEFTSEVFYERKLASKDGLDRQSLTGAGSLDGSGLWIFDVEHDGNRNFSHEEVEAVAALVARLLSADARWIDQHQRPRPMTMQDILIVAPYNAHVTRLVERLGPSARVGTVDKFQGQEAPVVIYSMATSCAEEAPRGMEFLYSLNRLNVATSRARCAAIIVASKRLFEPECKTPRQMKLANALCRYRELANVFATS
jgi:uncharacterized protein